ncbi:MAG TPA: hypothetical protein VMV23_09315 [Candidatus Nanopelagicaceae bacterium]|nr:hypothetical protein [Candidatus Nanopelagicaceae bacterium]
MNLNLPTLSVEFWTTRVGQAVSAILGIAASYGLQLSNAEKAAILAATVAFIPALLEIGWLHFRGLARSIIPAPPAAAPTHVIVATTPTATGVQASTPATVSAAVGPGESVTVSHSPAAPIA